MPARDLLAAMLPVMDSGACNALHINDFANRIREVLNTTEVEVVPKTYQERVVDERDALVVKAQALSGFIGTNPTFETLDAAEQERLKVQNDLMWQYAEVLQARIDAFV